MNKIKKSKKDKIEAYPEDTQENFEAIAISLNLEQQLISDITGLEEWELSERTPSWAQELAQRLLNRGWKKEIDL